LGSQTHIFSGRPAKILLDARKLGDGGIGVYIENIVAGLLQVGGIDITLVAKPGVNSSLTSLPGVSWVFDSSRPYSADELFFLPNRLGLSRFDLFHTPHYMLPFRISIPTVVTIHDLIHMTHPEKFYYPLIARCLIGSALRRAQAIVAVSQATRREVVETFGVPEDKVSFVPNGVAQFAVKSAAQIAPRNPLTDAYMLVVVSTPKPHKGIQDLLQAYSRFRTQADWRSVVATPPRLVIAGFGSNACIGSSAVGEGIEIAGAVPAELLGRLYRNASLLVVPSHAEGFCLPALEAQAVGTPVVCRPVPAIQEIVSPRDTVAADFSVDALAAAMATGLKKSAELPRVCDAQMLERYSCKTVAQQLVSVYQRLLQSKVVR
jgi:glycosyltransferase involved in cell wall biosynthesis